MNKYYIVWTQGYLFILWVMITLTVTIYLDDQIVPDLATWKPLQPSVFDMSSIPSFLTN